MYPIDRPRRNGKIFTPSKKDNTGGVSGVVNEGVNGAVNGGVKALLEYIQNNPGLRKPQISGAIGIPIRTLQRRLRELRDQNRIEFRGSPKTGGYHVKD